MTSSVLEETSSRASRGFMVDSGQMRENGLSGADWGMSETLDTLCKRHVSS